MQQRFNSKWKLAFIILSCLGAISYMADDTHQYSFFKSIFMGIALSAFYIAFAFGGYYLYTAKKRNKADASARYKHKLEEQQQAEAIRKQNIIKEAGKNPCEACGAPVSIHEKKCSYCKAINIHYVEID